MFLYKGLERPHAADEAPREENTFPEPKAGFPPGSGRSAVIY